MAAYKDLVGQKITKVTSNPGEPKTGQMWYNSTSGTLRALGLVSAWSSAGSMITARGYGTATGSQTASLYTGGLEPSGTYYANTEEYNGLGWSVGGALPTQNYAAASAGTQTAALFFGGTNNPGGKVTTTYTYNGSSWTATPNSMGTARDSLCGAGTQTSALAYGGRNPSNANVTNFEEWNGSSWTALTAIPTAVGYAQGSGPETAAFFASGGTNNSGSPFSTATQEFNGSSLSAGGNVNTGRSGGGASGNSSAGLIFGGDVGGTSDTKTETYDGTSFSEIADMATAMRGVGNGSGTTNAAAVVSGSYGPPALGTTEEFTTSTNVITAAAWASGGAYPTALLQLGGAGTQTAGLGFGGNGTGGNPNGSVISAEYNGSSWTSSGDLNQKGNTGSRTGVGTQTAALCVARRNDGTPSVSPVSYIAMNNVEEYNGSAWSNSPTLPAATVEAGSTGTTVAALYFGGSPGNPPAGLSGQSLYWNDTSWTATPSLNTSRAGIMSAFQGTYNASLGFGGSTGAPTYGVTNTELYNGSSWTNLGVMLEQKNRGSGHGTSTAALAAAGQNPSTTTNTQIWDGTNWSTSPSTASAQYFQGGGGSSTAAVIFAGADPSNYTTTTQEFTGKTTAVNIADFTTS